jgi:hypothetical protein
MGLKALRQRWSILGASPEARQRRAYRIAAILLVGVGLWLLAYNLGWLPDGVARGTAYWPGLVILAGLGLLFVGRPALGLKLPPFAYERGSGEEGELWVDAGAADLRVTALTGSDHLAAGAFPSYAGPKVETEGARVKLILDHRAAAPFLTGEWMLALNAHLPWAMHLRSSLGAVSLNLGELPVTALDLYAGVGAVDLTLPAMGQGAVNLRLGLGDLTVHMPDGVGVWLRLKAGPLVNLHLDGSRLTRTAPNEWATPDFSTAPQHFALTVDLAAGDLRLA